MLLDELFSGYDLEWFIKQTIKENQHPVDNAESQMRFWIKAHLTQLKDKDVASVPLSAIAKELNNVANEFGFAEVDKNEPDVIIDLIQGKNDKDKPTFVDKIENGVVYLKQKKKDHDRILDKAQEEAEDKHVSNMATTKAKKDIAKGKKL